MTNEEIESLPVYYSGAYRGIEGRIYHDDLNLYFFTEIEGENYGGIFEKKSYGGFYPPQKFFEVYMENGINKAKCEHTHGHQGLGECLCLCHS